MNMDDRNPSEPPNSELTQPPPCDLEAIEAAQIQLAVQTTFSPPSASDAKSLTALEESFELPELEFLKRLDERARRAELMAALLRAGGLSPEDAVRALQATLGAVASSASEANLRSISRLGAALRAVIGNLGIAPHIDDEARVVDTLVLDESELSRDLVALAVESQGHTVRCAATFEEFVREIHQRKPGLIITEIELSNAPARFLCATLRELLENSRAPLVLFSEVAEPELSTHARELGARRIVSKDRGVDGLILELKEVYKQIVALRAPGQHTRFQMPT
jgi:CheY-like chemotaxis protein